MFRFFVISLNISCNMGSFSIIWMIFLIMANFVVAERENKFSDEEVLKLFQKDDLLESTSHDRIGGIGNRYFSQDPLRAVKFYLYSNISNVQDYKEIHFGDENSLKEISIPDGTMLKIVIHGFVNEAFSIASQTVKDAYLQHSNNPVISFDWGAMSGYEAPFKFLRYPNISDFNVPKVSQHLAKFLIDLRKSQVLPSLDQVHLIGHSLGAHIAGQAGHIVSTISGGEKIGRITGLDPARPNFKDKDFHLRLDKEDAIFVDIIHTSSIMGEMRATGDVDFYPNSAFSGQPGCYGLSAARRMECSHYKAVEFFAQSISQNSMIGCTLAPSLARSGEPQYPRRCLEYCDKNVVFGEHISQNIKGEYCLKIE